MSTTIAWIEDDVDIIYPVVKQLEKAGHKIERLISAVDVINNIDIVLKCDLILLDIILPEGGTDESHPNGIALLRRLRSEFGVSAPVVILSVYRKEQVLKELQDDLRVVDVLEKPIRPSVLKTRVEKALGIS